MRAASGRAAHTGSTVHKAIENALEKCRETHRGDDGPYYGRDYLTARYEYHKLLVDRGILNPKLAEPNPSAYTPKLPATASIHLHTQQRAPQARSSTR